MLILCKLSVFDTWKCLFHSANAHTIIKNKNVKIKKAKKNEKAIEKVSVKETKQTNK